MTFDISNPLNWARTKKQLIHYPSKNMDLVHRNYEKWHYIFKTDVIKSADEESNIIFNHLLCFKQQYVMLKYK